MLHFGKGLIISNLCYIAELCKVNMNQSLIATGQLARHMASFFLEITDFCIGELNFHLKPHDPKIDDINNEDISQKQQQKLNFEHENHQKNIKQKQSKKFGKKKRIFENKPYFLQMKPKAPVSSYLLFLHQNKADISNRNHITNVSDVTKLASKQWKGLSEEERQKYCSQSQIQKQRYKEQMKVYTQKYAAQLKQYKRLKQIAYKSKWLQNKNKKADFDTQFDHYKQLKIQMLKKKLKGTIEGNRTIEGQNNFNDSSSLQNDKQLEIDFSDSNSV